MRGSRLGAEDLSAGVPLPWDLCDEAGRLLLRRGFFVEHGGPLARMLEAGLYRRIPADGAKQEPGVEPSLRLRPGGPGKSSSSVFEQIDLILGELEELLAHPAPGTFVAQVLQLADDIQSCFALDADASIATVQLLTSHRYSTRRLVHAAILMELLLSHRGESAVQRRLALAAALTMNLAMLDLQDILNHQTAQPDPQQKALLRQHPERGVETLRGLGVDDPSWLDMVAQHHETIDGKGYPLGLRAAQISTLAQILSMVDRYGSMAIGRAYRSPVLPNVVLKQIFMDKQSVAPELAALLVSAVGMYPPGSLVALAGGERAVVLRRSKIASQPLVAVLKDHRGQRLDRPRRRLTSEPGQAISRLLSQDELGFLVDPSELWNESFEIGSAIH